MLTFTGVEGISRLYSFEVMFFVAATDAEGLDEEALLLQPATLILHRADGSPRQHIHGIFASVEFVASHADEAVFRAVIVPRLWKLTLTRHSRVWVEGSRPDTIPNIIDTVLKANGLAAADFTINVSRSYTAQLHVCQYKESDFDFIARWMEREGMYFYFEQSDAGEKLIIIDRKDAQESLGDAVRYFATGDEDTNEVEAMETFRARHAALPTEYKARDYDYLRPAGVEGGPEPIADNGHGQLVGWGENFDIKPSPERRIPSNRAGEVAAKQKVFHGRGRLFDLRPGYFFELEEHPRHALNGRYLTVELEHHGNQLAAFPALRRVLHVDEGRTYKVHVTAIPADTQYRAPRRVPWPRIYGVESAVIDGPLNNEDYAQIDSHGRYRVKIHFDESTLRDGKASMLVRMLQPHSGDPEGFHFPLRKGTEVMLVFLGGDPDRPVITGAVPNPATPSPVTESNHTQNVVQTGGRSRLEIEDTDGSQYVDISTPPQNTHIHLGATHGPHTHNWVVSTDGTGLLHTGGNHDVTVGGDMTEDVQGDLTETYHANQTTHVMGNFDETVDGSETRTVNSGSTETIHAGHTQTIDGGSTETVTGDHSRTVNGSVTHTVTGDVTAKVGGSVTETVSGSVTETVVGGITTTTPATYSITAIGGMKVVAPGGWQLIAPGGTQTVDSFFDKTGGKSADAFAFKMSIAGAKVDIVPGLSFGYSAIKVDITGTKADITGAKFANNPAKIESAGQFLLHSYCSLHLCGFLSIL